MAVLSCSALDMTIQIRARSEHLHEVEQDLRSEQASAKNTSAPGAGGSGASSR